MSQYETPDKRRPCQGAIYKDIQVSYFTPPEEGKESTGADCWEFPYAVALSQECDLDQDHKRRELIRASASSGEPGSGEALDYGSMVLSVLVCPAYLAESFKEGSHLRSLNWKIKVKGGALWTQIKANQHARYHYLAACPDLQVPEAVVDFKHFFTLPTELIYSKYNRSLYYIARLTVPFREDLSHRFAFFLSRIGLPDTARDQVVDG